MVVYYFLVCFLWVLRYRLFCYNFYFYLCDGFLCCVKKMEKIKIKNFMKILVMILKCCVRVVDGIILVDFEEIII